MNKLSAKTRITLTAPFTVWMAVFVVVPIGLVLFYALTDASGSFTLQNLSSIWAYRKTYVLSLELAFVATVLCLLLAYPLAYSISKMKARRQQTMVLLVMLPMWMNFLIRTYAWMTILEDTGLINTFLKSFLSLFGFQFQGFSMINTNGAIILGMVYNFLPYMILPIYTSLSKMDPSLLEAAYDLGANKIQAFTKVVFKYSIPGVLNGVILTFLMAISAFVIPKLLGGGQYTLLGNLIENQFISVGNWNFGSAISFILAIVILLTISFLKRIDPDDEA